MSPKVRKPESLIVQSGTLPFQDTDGQKGIDNRDEVAAAEVWQTAPIRILLMCSHPIERVGIRLILERRTGMTLVGDIGADIEEFRALGPKADVIVLDLSSAAGRDLELLRRVVEMAGRGRVLVLANTSDRDLSRHVAHLGAMGVVDKDQSVEILVKAITKVHSGEVWFGRATMAGVLRQLGHPDDKASDGEAASRIASLTKREREVIQLLGHGLNPETLAQRLFISETTVRHHLSSILEKLGVRDRFDLVFYAYRHGLSAPPASSEAGNNRS